MKIPYTRIYFGWTSRAIEIQIYNLNIFLGTHYQHIWLANNDGDFVKDILVLCKRRK